jgi:hypothetical protein
MEIKMPSTETAGAANDAEKNNRSLPNGAAPEGLRSLFEDAALNAVDFVTGGDNHSAQICVQLAGSPISLNIDSGNRAANGSNYFWAATNDSDDVGTPASFHSRSEDPAELKDAIVSYLLGKFAGTPAVIVRVFRRIRGEGETVLSGTSADGKLTETELRVVARDGAARYSQEA